MKITRSRLSFACLAVVVSGAALSAPVLGSPDLRPRWKPGAESRFIVTVENTQTTTPPGATAPEPAVTTRQEVLLTRRVVNADASGTELMIRYEQAKVRISVGSDSVAVDTSLPAERDGDSDLGASVRDAVGKVYSVFLDDAGRPMRIEGNKITRGNLPSSRGIAGDEVFRFHFAPLYGLPGLPKSLASDNSWAGSERFLAGHLGTIVTNFTGVMPPASGDEAKFTLIGKPEVAPAVGPMALTSENLGGSYEGSGVWDVRAGSIKSFDSVRVIKYAVESVKGKSTIESRLALKVEPAPLAPKPAAATEADKK